MEEEEKAGRTEMHTHIHTASRGLLVLYPLVECPTLLLVCVCVDLNSKV